MNSIRQIQELNKRELENGVYVYCWHYKFQATDPMTGPQKHHGMPIIAIPLIYI